MTAFAKESERLKALARYHLLDTPEEAEFDRLVRLAAQICQAPIALLSLTDAERQWHKARFGIEARQLPRKQAICPLALGGEGLLEISDTRADARVRELPLVRENDIRFYAGEVLRTPEGHALGALCVMDHVPRVLTPEQRFGLQTLAEQLQLLFEWRLARFERPIPVDFNLDSEEVRQLLECSPVALLMIRLGESGDLSEGRTLYVNLAFTRLLGYLREDIPDLESWFRQAYPNRDYREMIVAEGSRRVQRPVFENAGFDSNEIWICDKSGQTHLCEVTRSRFGDMLLISLYDITHRKEIEAALRESEENLRSLIEASPVPMVLLQIGGSGQTRHLSPVLHLNRAFTELFGYTLKDLPDAQHMLESLYPDPQERETALRQSRNAMTAAGDSAIGISLAAAWMTAKDGNRHHVEQISSRFEDKVIVCYYDLTERYRMEEALRASEARTRQYLDALPIGVSIMGPDARLQYVNRKAIELQGRGLDPDAGPDALAEVYQAYVRGSDTLYPFERMPLLRALQGESVVVDDMELQHPAGRIPIEVHGSPVYDSQGNITSAIVAFSDIRERLRFESALREAKELAETANRTKSEFLANMSHEIRTPMNAIIGLNHLLEKTGLNVKQLDYVRKIQSSAQNLMRVINDILDFSKIEAGKLELENISFNLNQVLTNLSTLLSLKADEQGLELIFDLRENVPEALIGDSLRLEQILLNLVTNAIKFTPAGSVTVAIRVEEEGPQDVLLRFSVRDTGIGLSEAQRARLFQAFSQADASTTRQYGGTGLGLTICKRLVEIMGGEIGVESQLNAGSCFWFTARFSKGGETPRMQILPEELLGMRALVVDDQVHVQEIISDYLRGFGMKVLTAGSGKAALQIFQNQTVPPIRLVLMDWKMPGPDGIETIRQLRAQLPTDKQPAVILMTAYGREDLLQRLEHLRVEGILLKPLTPSMVYDSLLEALDLGRSDVRDIPLQDAGWREQLRPFQGARLLVVEDNVINQQVAQELLESEGFYVQLAKHGKQALERLAEFDYDLVLMDLQMPVMDGYHATRMIRQQPALAGLPVLAMTADAVAGVREQVLQAGMNDCITKPIEMAELFNALARWLPESARSRQPLPQRLRPEGPYLPEIAGIDIRAALQRASGNTALYLGLLETFCRNYADFATIYARLPLEERYRWIHTLTGVTGNLGMETLSQLARRLEAQLKAGEPAAVSELDSGIATMIARLQEVLTHFRPEPEAASAGELDPEQLAAFVEMLEQFDPEAQAMLATLPFADELSRQLRQALDDFDFMAALKVLQDARLT